MFLLRFLARSFIHSRRLKMLRCTLIKGQTSENFNYGPMLRIHIMSTTPGPAIPKKFHFGTEHKHEIHILIFAGEAKL
jgi:hypothetical protein